MVEFTSLLLPLAVGTAVVLAFLAGISTCLSVWIIPIISHASPRIRITQFTHMTDLGFKYLQPSSRILAVALLTLTVATYRDNTDALGHDIWKFCLTALMIIVPIAPYEIMVIFPINGRVREIGYEIINAAASEREKIEAKYDRELARLLTSWQWDNAGRFVPPFAASLILFTGLVSAS